MEMNKNLGYFKDRLENFYNNQLSKYKYDFNKLIQINEYIIIEKRFNNFAKYLITIQIQYIIKKI